MKDAGTLNWASPNTGGNNESGFAGLPGGSRGVNGPFSSVGLLGYWWSSTESSTTNAWFRGLNYNFGLVSRDDFSKRFGYSVRCLRD